MKKHAQILVSFGAFAFCSASELEIVRGDRVIKESPNIPIDQFYSEDHNKQNGYIDTSPRHYDDASFASHIGDAVREPNLPKSLSDDERFELVVSKHCQSPSEIAALRKVRPVESDFVEVESPVEESVQTPVES